MNKIQNNHLNRPAYVYVRQSSKEQVENNIESQRLQYRLKERAKSLGWKQIEVIDEDLGKSGSGTVQRSGFERVLSDVCAGGVGAVLAIDASRFARNGREWHTLLEVCGLVDTLIIDYDSIYDVRYPNDRLLLGMKGTLSEMELGILRQRMMQAAKEKARRGELYSRLPVGYRKDNDENLVKDPDIRVQEAIELILKKFRELGSARQVVRWFRQEEIEVPIVPLHTKGYCVVWKLPLLHNILGILTNPIYAGAYTYGRTKRQTILDNGVKRTKTKYNRNPEEWEVLIHEHHEGYFKWEEYMKIQQQLSKNNSQSSKISGGATRNGAALMSGLVRCGQCGRKMSVVYHQGKKEASYRYCCIGDAKTGESGCFAVSGKLVDNAIDQVILDTVSPLATEAAIQAIERLEKDESDLVRHYELKLEHAQYEADRMHRQYNAVEPENRLVATQLETRWNQALEQVEEAKKEFNEVQSKQKPLTEKEHKQILRLADDLKTVWKHPSSSNDIKKRIIRTILKEIIIHHGQDDNPFHDTIEVVIHWEGGDHTRLALKRKRRASNGAVTNAEAIHITSELARVMNDRDIAMFLNRSGSRTARGCSWSQDRIVRLRRENNIAPFVPGEREKRGELTIDEAAKELGTYRNKILRLIKAQALPAKQVCFRAPWIIKAEDLKKFTNQTLVPEDSAEKQLKIDFSCSQ